MKTNNLLIVEDHSYINSKIAEEALKIDAIKNIHVSETLEEAFKILNSKDIEVITLDLSLPDGNGLDILLYLKEKELKKKVIVFSSNAELKNACLRFGAHSFVDKNNSFDSLIDNLKVI